MKPTYYDPRLKKWQSSREHNSESAFRLHPVTDVNRVIRASRVQDDPGASTRITHQDWNNQLVRGFRDVRFQSADLGRRP